MRYLFFIAIFMLAAGWNPRISSAQEMLDDPVQAGREALDGRVSFPWYDAEKDALRRVNLEANDNSAAANRNSRWEGKAKPVQQAAPAGGGSSWWGDFLWGIIQVLFYTILVLLFLALIAGLVWAFLKREARNESAASAETYAPETEIDRIEKLPFQVQRPLSDLLAEAQRQYEAGNYSEAIIYLFSYQLVELDKHQLIRLAKGKTNRQYMAEVRRLPQLRGLLERTMVAFEDVFFGSHPLHKQRFEARWQELDQFHQQLEQVAV